VTEIIKQVMESKYKAGDVVCERIYPAKKLIVSRYADKLYYCRVPENLKLKELVYFEWELMAVNTAGSS
jgi:hypothetical protein